MPRPKFSKAEPLDLDEEERDDLLKYIADVYAEAIDRRDAWEKQHLEFEKLFRGELEPREGPWPGSADMHVPMPYWLVDAFNVRLVSTVWSQQPLVGGEATEDDDQEIFRDVSRYVAWHLGPRRMRAKDAWNRASKIRLIHGMAVMMPHFDTSYKTYKEDGITDIKFNERNQLAPQEGQVVRKKVKYSGPVLTPLDFDDVVISSPHCMNLQPNDPVNTRGAEWVAVRQWASLNQILDKYGDDLPDEWQDREEWIKAAQTQDRATTARTNNEQARYQLSKEGFRPALSGKSKNPEYEKVLWMGPWKDPQGEDDETCEMAVEICLQPKLLLRAFRLSDLYYSNKRPLIELHFQTLGTRIYSLGVIEVVNHLSAEIDAIHNLRLDVGIATNLPFIFYSPSSQFDPDSVELKPMAAIPVEDPSKITIPQMANVTSFYFQEEQQLYALVERVLGITDLFLGVSPTTGAAARHATGFVGTQQEALARVSQVISQDAHAFSDLCHWVYDLDMQYGPTYRSLRLLGKKGPLATRVSLDQLWMQGEYDFALGANEGTYSTLLRQQRAQAVLQTLPNNPFMMQDPGRLWEVYADYYYSIGLNTEEIEARIGPKNAVSLGPSKSQVEENLMMAQYLPGPGLPVPVHPADDDRKHTEEVLAWLSSPEFAQLGRPNEEAYYAHNLLHKQAAQQKQMRTLAAQQQQGMGGNGKPPMGAPPQESTPTPGGQDRMLAGMMAQPGASQNRPVGRSPGPPQGNR